jgi:hypothetical protein
MFEPRLGRDPNLGHEGMPGLGSGRLIPVPGLDPEAIYTTAAPHPAQSGKALATTGLRLFLPDFSSTVLHLKRQG